VEPVASKGTTVTYGPYREVQPFAYEPFTVHAMNNKPFARFTSAVREVEVSHWGNVAIEEIYELVHAGTATDMKRVGKDQWL
jgi:oligosaccharyltransferase complex subunit alpha (ribophorin I)